MKIFGDHEQKVIDQLDRCVSREEGAQGVLCADGHFGYSAPIGGVIGYHEYVSPAAVGYDIGCIARGERVLTSDGYHVAIEDLTLADDICKPGVDGLITPVSPYLGVVSQGVKETFVVDLGRRSVRVTADHELRTRRGWVQAVLLDETDEVLCPVFKGLPYEPCSISAAFLRIAAYINGDGHIPGIPKNRQTTNRLDITTSITEDVEGLSRDLESLCGRKPGLSSRIRPNGSLENALYISDPTLHDALVEFGCPIGRKKGTWRDVLLENLLALPAWARAQYLSAFAGAEGSTPSWLKSGLVPLVIKQRGLDAAQIVLALVESLGFSASLLKTDTELVQLTGGVDEQLRFIEEVGFAHAIGKRRAAAQAYSVALYREAARASRDCAKEKMGTLRERGYSIAESSSIVAAEYGMTISAVQHLHYRNTPTRVPRGWIDTPNSLGECIWLPVRSIKGASTSETFDVVTEDPAQSFIVNGVTVHNCGNLATRTNLLLSDIEGDLSGLMDRVYSEVSFGMGRNDGTAQDHHVIDMIREEGTEVQRGLVDVAARQLGTVGAGNHYVDLLADEQDRVWVGVHFGSRGFGHKTATYYLNLAAKENGHEYKEGGGEMEAAPDLLHVDEGAGDEYLQAMTIAGWYAHHGRKVVVEQVMGILGCYGIEEVHNHHNYCWMEMHGGDPLYVVRKGATPAFPGQRGFVGATMAEPAVILEGVDSPLSREALFSTVHGAGRAMSRTAAAGKTRKRWACTNRDCDWRQTPGTHKPENGRCPSCRHNKLAKRWVKETEGAIDWEATLGDLSAKRIELRGANAEEAPGAYKRLDDVLAAHAGTIKVLHTLRPIGVAMASGDTRDDYKD